MKKQSQTKFIGTISAIVVIALLIWLAWYFSTITLFIIVSVIITLLAAPIKQLLQKIKIGKKQIGNNLSSVLSLLVIIGFITLLFCVIIPPIHRQISSIANLNPYSFQNSYNEQLQVIDEGLQNIGFLAEDESLEEIVFETVVGKIKTFNVSTFFSNVIQMIGDLFLGIFSILFISFFFLKDVPKLQRYIINMMPNRYQKETSHILTRSQRLLSNYFAGLAVEVVIMGVLEFILLSVLHIENALLIAVLGGILVIIPFLGSIIACVLGCVLAVMGGFMLNPEVALVPIVLKVVGTFVFCRLLDNFFLQPYIASRSVKAHPLEIFLIVLISG
ncbi:MAG: AI-2E family transporter, partial [Bacteroidales bacterium]|nr:AI-2E family transporter [Bacteroidales bacterium]